MVINATENELVYFDSVNFETDLSQYGTKAGSVSSEQNPAEVFSFPAMWLEALDLLFAKTAKLFDLKKISAISGSGQQHAGVYLDSSFNERLARLDARKTLAEQISGAFTRTQVPIWMDTSTSAQCEKITQALGQDGVLERSGSIAIERFTGPQIRKFAEHSPQDYERTHLIHLNSSFMCSVLAGQSAPIDHADGAGMNLANIHTWRWDSDLLDATVRGLAQKLPTLAPSDTCVGTIAPYFCEKYGLCPSTKIIAFTGDNPSSLVGTGAVLQGRATISLGTSDTLIYATRAANPMPDRHVLGGPAGGYMTLICFRNGSLARERLKNELGVDWNFFDKTAFENYTPQDDNALCLPFYFDEISPKLRSSTPVFENMDGANSAQKVRTFIEGQFFNMYVQCAQSWEQAPQTIVLTGGASKSGGIARTIANIFGAQVARLKLTDNSAALGAAMRAAHAACAIPMERLVETFCTLEPPLLPNKDITKLYAKKIDAFIRARKRHYGV